MLLGYDRLRMPDSISRRSFGKRLAAVPLSRAFADERGMFLSLNGVLLQGRVQWLDFARLAAKTGFHGTDIMLRLAMRAGVRTTNHLLADLKIRPAAMDFPSNSGDDATFKASVAELEQPPGRSAIRCPRIIMPSSDTPNDELRHKQRFTESAPILPRHNVRLGLEFLGPLELRKAHKYEFGRSETSLAGKGVKRVQMRSK